MMKCNITYLFSLNLNTKIFKKKPPLSILDKISAFNYRAIKNFKLISIRKNEWITSERSANFIRDIQTKYSHWFRFPEAEDRFITKSLVGIEDACPICGGDEDLDKCVMVRGGCGHAFHRGCLEHWFSQCGKRRCPACRTDHDESG